MRIGFDMYPQQIFKTGVRVVIDNLLATLRTRFPEHSFIELRPTQAALPTSRHAYGRKAYNHLQRVMWTQVGLPLAARRAQCDVLFCTCMFSPYIQPLPTVTLIYDMAIWRHPEWYPRPWFWINRLFTELPAHWNTRITTISEDARKDIVELFALKRSAVSAIHLGLDMPTVDAGQDAEILASYNIPAQARYVLYMGPAIAHKNLLNLVKAFGLLLRRLPAEDLYLVIGGPASNSHGKDVLASIHAAAAESGASERLRFTGFVPRDHVPILYRNALLYAFPSLFEGFGLPMIEAMANGAPVVSSDRTSLPEIGGDAAIYFDPLSVTQMAEALYLVATQPNLRAEMGRRGRQRAEQFTWEHTADAYMQVFTEVARA